MDSEQLIGPGELLGSSFSFFAKNWKILLSIASIPFLSVIAAVVVLFLGLSSHAPAIIAIAFAIDVILYACFFVGIVCLYPALVSAVHRLSTETSPVLTVWGQYKLSLKLFWSFLLLMIITGLVAYGSLAFLIVPGVIVAVYIMLYVYTFTLDGKKGFSALSESYSLVKGRWWRVFGRLFLLIAVLVGAVFVFQIFFFMASGLLFLIAAPLGLIISVPLLFIFEILVLSFALVYMYKLYDSLKKTRAAEVSTKAFKAWAVFFLIIGIPVATAYFAFVLPNIVNKARQDQSAAQANLSQAEMQQIMQRYSSTTAPQQY